MTLNPLSFCLKLFLTLISSKAQLISLVPREIPQPARKESLAQACSAQAEQGSNLDSSCITLNDLYKFSEALERAFGEKV